MLRYMRSSEAKGDENGTQSAGNSPTKKGYSTDAQGALGGSPMRPSSTQSGTQLPPHTAHAPLPLHVRQQLAEAAKLPLPAPSRGANSVPPAASSPSKPSRRQHQQDQLQRQGSFHHAGSDAGDSIGSHPPAASSDQQQQQIWEDSSINSMFAESVATTARPPPQRVVNLGRHGSPFPQQRTQHRYERLAGAARGNQEPAGTLPPRDRAVPRVLPTKPSIDAVDHGDDPYIESPPYGPSPRAMPAPKPSKYALRDARGPARQASVPDRQPSGVYDDANSGSPEPRARPRAEHNSRLQAAALPDHEDLDQDTGDPRMALFGDVSAPLGAGHQPETDRSDIASESDEAPNQRTPRQNRATPPVHPPQQPPAAPPPKRILQESSLPRVGGGVGGRRDRKLNRKRRHSPDYDDSMLHSMNYTELRDEPFDHDPARMAVQAPAVPANLSLEDRLVHFKTKEATSQRHFFTEMSVREWDESGDWFLEQFAELSNKIREKRQEKRRRMAEFEEEITERENTVRHKAESIERTLGDLKNEGEGMMRNRVVDF